VLPFAFITEDVDGIGNIASGDTTAVDIQILLEVFLHIP
jgi:hypothetical protein